jgi:hypothetical protein
LILQVGEERGQRGKGIAYGDGKSDPPALLQLPGPRRASESREEVWVGFIQLCFKTRQCGDHMTAESGTYFSEQREKFFLGTINVA